MSPRARALIVIGGLAAIVGLFLIARPRDDEPSPAAGDVSTFAAPTPTPTAPAETGSTAPVPTTPAPPPAPKVDRIRVQGLKPVGGVKEIKVEKGDTVRFSVSSDQAENVHLHGYDIEKAVAPGKPVRFTLKANIEGIFEVELENNAVPIASLTVSPS